MNQVLCQEVPKSKSHWVEHEPETNFCGVDSHSLILKRNEANHCKPDSHTTGGSQHEGQE